VPNPKRPILPVVREPIVRVCLFVVAKVPSPVIYVALLPRFAEMLAVGVPVALFINPNFADWVAAPPSRKSFPVSNGAIAPSFSWKKLNALDVTHSGR